MSLERKTQNISDWAAAEKPQLLMIKKKRGFGRPENTRTVKQEHKQVKLFCLFKVQKSWMAGVGGLHMQSIE